MPGNNKTKFTIFRFLALLIGLGQAVPAVSPAQEVSTAKLGESPVAKGSAQSGMGGGASSPALTGQQTNERHPLYRLHKSDVIEIAFTFSPEFDQTATLRPDGYIALKGLADLYAEGNTLDELLEAIRLRYQGTLHDPEITVHLKEFERPFFIAGGDVGRPGKYELRSDTTVTEAIAIAGGFTAQAKHSQVVLFRRVADDFIEAHLINTKSMLRSRDLKEDFHLRPGDLIFVPQNMISKIRRFIPSSMVSAYLNPAQF